MKHRSTWVFVIAVGMMSIAAAADETVPPTSHPSSQLIQLDLQKQFRTRAPWRLVVTAGELVKDYGDNDAPGPLTLCLQQSPTGPCVSAPVTPPPLATTSDHPNAWEPHYLFTADIVYPRGPSGAPLLLIVTGSVHSGNGNHIVATQLVRYDSQHDEFRRIYNKSTGHNNNQEIRFITSGVLRGSVISAEPQEHAPFRYSIAVDRLTSTSAYRQVLRYSSATRYSDGNPLAVIDSEMPNIERRLGLWKSGEPLPSPRLAGDGKPCTKPTMKSDELWCE
jgi:hypothetical protein